MTWADKYRKLGIRTNADTPEDAEEQENLVLKVLDFVEQNTCFLQKIESKQ
jgi:hypothetical protein